MGERPFLSLKGKLSDFFYNFTAYKLIQTYISVSHLDIFCDRLRIQTYHMVEYKFPEFRITLCKPHIFLSSLNVSRLPIPDIRDF